MRRIELIRKIEELEHELNEKNYTIDSLKELIENHETDEKEYRDTIYDFGNCIKNLCNTIKNYKRKSEQTEITESEIFEKHFKNMSDEDLTEYLNSLIEKEDDEVSI